MTWDDPFWHVVRMLVDLTRGKALQEKDILPTLAKANTEASLGLTSYLHVRPDMIAPLAEYMQFRAEAAAELLSLARTEGEALANFHELSTETVCKVRNPIGGSSPIVTGYGRDC